VNSPTWADDDDQLLEVVKDTLTDNDVVMDRMREAALAAFTWRTIDLELEQLTLAFDSAGEHDLAFRGTTGEASRMLTFTGPTVGLELEIDDSTIIGQLIPAESGLVTLLLAAGGETEIPTDEVGWFTIPRPVNGPYRLRCVAAESTVVTEWLT